MYIINSESANGLFVKASKSLLKNGHYVSPRGLKTLELNNVYFILSNIDNNVIDLPERKLSLNYLNAELNWYLSGDLNVESIGKSSKFWYKLADKNDRVNSNYGYLALYEEFNGMSQYEWCLNKLTSDIFSRQAVINYNQPRHKYEGNKDFVCTMFQQFLYNRQTGLLDSTVVMRSNDLVYGFSYDLPWFVYLQKKLSNDLGVGIGVYNHFMCSLHVYEKHFDMIKKSSLRDDFL